MRGQLQQVFTVSYWRTVSATTHVASTVTRPDFLHPVCAGRHTPTQKENRRQGRLFENFCFTRACTDQILHTYTHTLSFLWLCSFQLVMKCINSPLRKRKRIIHVIWRISHRKITDRRTTSYSHRPRNPGQLVREPNRDPRCKKNFQHYIRTRLSGWMLPR